MSRWRSELAREMRLARRAASRSVAQAVLASARHWERNLDRARNQHKVLRKTDTCALCLKHREAPDEGLLRFESQYQCYICPLGEGKLILPINNPSCCQEWQDTAHGGVRAAKAMLDKLAVIYVEMTGKSVTLGGYIYYLSEDDQ